MKRWARIPVQSICLLLGLFVVLSSPARATDRANIVAFLDVTGFDVALDSIAFSAADAPAILGMEPSDFGADWYRVSNDVFDVELMRDMAVEILSETLTLEHLGHAAGFYASSLGQRLVMVENAAHADDDTASKRALGTALIAEARRDEPERVELFDRMNMAVDGAGQSVRALQEIMVRFLTTASAAGVLDVQIDEGQLRAMLKRDEDEMRREMQVSSAAYAAYTYREVSTEDLTAYVEALEHPKMKTVYELMNAVQFEIMANRFEVLAVRMADMHPGQEL